MITVSPWYGVRSESRTESAEGAVIFTVVLVGVVVVVDATVEVVPVVFDDELEALASKKVGEVADGTVVSDVTSGTVIV